MNINYYDKLADIVVNLLTTAINLVITLIFVFLYLRYTRPDDPSVQSFQSFIAKFLNEKIGKTTTANRDVRKLPQKPGLIQTVDESSIENSREVIECTSKNYGGTGLFSVTSSFRVASDKLDKSQYIHFVIKNVANFYVKTSDFQKQLEQLSDDQQNEGYRKNFFETYISQTKRSNKWFIVRIGTGYTVPVELQ